MLDRCSLCGGVRSGDFICGLSECSKNSRRCFVAVWGLFDCVAH